MFRELVRKKQALSREECIEVLQKETRGVLSVQGDGGYPYGMPMNHFYDDRDGCIWFHSGNVGHRLEALGKNDKVSFCTWDKGFREEGQWAWKVRSVIVFGRVEIISDMEQIVDITTRLCRKFPCDEAYIQKEIAGSGHRTLLLKLTPEHTSGKLVTEA